MDNFVIFQGYIFSSKDDLKDYASQMYALIICNQTDKQQIIDSLEDFIKKLNDKVSYISFHLCSFCKYNFMVIIFKINMYK